MRTRRAVGIAWVVLVLVAGLVIALAAGPCVHEREPGARQVAAVPADNRARRAADAPDDPSGVAPGPHASTAGGVERRQRARPAADPGRSRGVAENADEDAEPPFVVRLVDAERVPVAGARVLVYVHTERPPVDAGLTDSHGRVEIDPDGRHANVVASRGDLVSAAVPVPRPDEPGETRTAEVVLTGGVVIRGVAVRPDGSPCADLPVWIGEPWGGAADVAAMAVSGPGGRFEFARRPRAPRERAVSAGRIARQDVSAAIDWDRPESIVQLVIPWEVDVVGRCVAADGTPLPNPDSPAAHLLFQMADVGSPGRARVTQFVDTDEWEADIAWAGVGPVIDLGDIVFRPPVPLRGVVLEPSGAPASEVGVSVLGGTRRGTVMTDADGRFAFARTPGDGEYLLIRAYLAPPLGADGTEGTPVRAWTILDAAEIAAAGSRGELRVLLTPNPVARLRLVTNSGAPVSAQSAELHRSPELSPRPLIDGAVVSLALVGPPPWVVEVRAVGGRSALVTIAAGGSLERDVVIGVRDDNDR